MNDDDVRERLRQDRQRHDNTPALDVVRQYLQAHCADAEGFEEIRRDAVRMNSINPRPVQRASRALDAVLADPPEDLSFNWLVAQDANWALDDPSEENSKAFLADIAAMLHEVLGE